jgi:hypothetical protein
VGDWIVFDPADGHGWWEGGGGAEEMSEGFAWYEKSHRRWPKRVLAHDIAFSALVGKIGLSTMLGWPASTFPSRTFISNIPMTNATVRELYHHVEFQHRVRSTKRQSSRSSYRRALYFIAGETKSPLHFSTQDTKDQITYGRVARKQGHLWTFIRHASRKVDGAVAFPVRIAIFSTTLRGPISTARKAALAPCFATEHTRV